ncbi:MAG: hydrogenase maturation nickel metallochaperone HypA/HybF [Desulfitobacteriaceae bacterium]
MHEMGLMAEMINILARSARENKIHRITKINLVVGKMSQALPDALQMAFEVYKTEEMFSPLAILEIEERETIAHCTTCEESFPVPDNYQFVCPICLGLRVEIISGRELYIANYEGEEI